MQVANFYNKIIEVFNDASFVPETQVLPDLHEHYVVSRQLTLGEYRLTRDTAKDIMVGICPKLSKICTYYKQSGAGAG